MQLSSGEAHWRRRGGAEVGRRRKLELLLEGIPRAASSCEGCAGMRFIMCMDCSGSCKVLDEEQKKMVKCGVCNENGLLHCPICC
ncbi:Glutaredoxin [Musa troglodytarum]|uniref:Glutaredoxin n=1 Tax=Musa troglodytarum TaxID=320322 RepID=A0A9E7G678_9LILI|nr:Glutaredoxin [Musa troglodytarum]